MNFGGTAAAAAKPAFGFGAPASAPASATSTTGFSFGATPPVGAAKPQPTLSSGFSFAGSSQQTAFGPTTPASQPAVGFGATPAFGAAAGATPVASAPAFGGFGTPAAPSTATAGFGGGFGAASNKPATLSLGGGLGNTTTTASVGFGQSLTANAPAKPAFGFGSGTSAFGTASSAAPSAFGTLAPTTATAGLGFGAAAAPAASTAFGLAPATSQPGFGGFGGATATAAPAVAGLGGTTTSASVGLGGTATLSGTTPFGVPSSQAAGTPPVTQVKQGKDDSWKDTPIPPELTQDIDIFRKFVKDQKSVSTDMTHLSLPKLHQKIQADVNGLNVVVKQLGSGVAKQKAQLERIKKDCAKELVNVEVAQRTKDTPPALQYENNNGPIEYFHKLIANFEAQMISYKRQIEDVEHYLQTLSSDPATSTPETLLNALQKTHAAFVSLAGRYQPMHEAIQQQKSLYVQQYRQKHGTTENPFGKKQNTNETGSRSNSILGPSPFTGKPDPLSLAKAAAQQALAGQPTTQVGAPGGPPALGLGTASSFGFGGGAPASGFGNPAGSAFNMTGLGAGNTSMFGAAQNKSAFGQPVQQQSSLGTPLGGGGGTSLFSSPAAPSSTGLFGTTMSPFGQQQQPQNAFGFGGKRGKH